MTLFFASQGIACFGHICYIYCRFYINSRSLCSTALNIFDKLCDGENLSLKSNNQVSEAPYLGYWLRIH